MSKVNKIIGLFLFVGVICSSCLLLVSKPKEQVITVEMDCSERVEIEKSICKELDSLNSYYCEVEGFQTIPNSVFRKYCEEVTTHYSGIRAIFYDPACNPRLRVSWIY